MRIVVIVAVVVGLIGGTVSCGRSRAVKSPDEAKAFSHPLVETRKLEPSVKQSGPLFKKLTTQESGIDFVHHWVLPEEYPHDLETQMAGGGIAVGDFDKDGLPDIYLSRPFGGNRLYKNLGSGRFQDVTESAKVLDDTYWGGGASFVDIDNDGDLDLYACGHDCPNRLFVNLGNGTFAEQAKSFGLDFHGASVMMAFADYDNDGDLDGYLLTNRLNPPASLKMGGAAKIDGKWVVPQEVREFRKILVHPNGKPIPIYAAQYDHLFENQGPNDQGQFTFSDVSAQAGIAGNDHGLAAIWWDYNQDGLSDLYVANDFTDPDYLYKNKGDGSFEEVLAESVPHTPWFSMGADIGDINNDGRMDLFATDMAGTNHYKQKVSMGDMWSDMWFLDHSIPRQYMRNAMYLNTGTKRFMEIAFLAGLAQTDWTWAPRFADFDNDGHIDLFVTNGMTRDWQNSDLKHDAARLGGKETQAGREFWINQPPRTEANLAFKNLGDLRFENVGPQWGLNHVGVSFGAATADLDRDGDLDLIVNNFEEHASVYLNQSNNNRVIFKLRGASSNRDGIGATIELNSKAETQSRYLTLSRGFMSSSEPIVHFGLGQDERIPNVTIRWPSGEVQSFQNMRANYKYTITEPTGPGSAIVGHSKSNGVVRTRKSLSAM